LDHAPAERRTETHPVGDLTHLAHDVRDGGRTHKPVVDAQRPPFILDDDAGMRSRKHMTLVDCGGEGGRKTSDILTRMWPLARCSDLESMIADRPCARDVEDSRRVAGAAAGHRGNHGVWHSDKLCYYALSCVGHGGLLGTSRDWRECAVDVEQSN